MQQLKVMISGGGTGGHIFPAVAIGHAIKRLRPDAELLFVGAHGKMEMEKVPQEGFDIVGLDIAGFNRSNMLKNILLPYKLLKSAWQARKLIHQFQPQLVIGVGGYASFPILKAAQMLNVPTLIQEQNSFAGKSNKLLGKKAKLICVAYDNMAAFFPEKNIRITGNPVRQSIAYNHSLRAESLSYFDLQQDRKAILIVGGSLGALSINQAIDKDLEQLVATGFQIIWQTGKAYFEQAKQRALKFKDQVKVMDFIKPMDKAYAVADFVVSRAGALAIAELCIVAKPVVFVPYPYAAEDHQTSNARSLVTKKAALMVKDSEAMDQLWPVLESLIQDEAQQVEMQHNLEQLAIKNADELIANYAIEVAQKGN